MNSQPNAMLSLEKKTHRNTRYSKVLHALQPSSGSPCRGNSARATRGWPSRPTSPAASAPSSRSAAGSVASRCRPSQATSSRESALSPCYLMQFFITSPKQISWHLGRARARVRLGHSHLTGVGGGDVVSRSRAEN